MIFIRREYSIGHRLWQKGDWLNKLADMGKVDTGVNRAKMALGAAYEIDRVILTALLFFDIIKVCARKAKSLSY